MFSFFLVNSPENFVVDTKRIEEIFVYISENVPIIQKGILNIAFLPDEEIRILNRDYRWIDRTTDVLSFHYHEDFSDLENMEVAGECLFSEEKILLQAWEHGHLPEEEFFILLIHSILHILGFDHETDEDYAQMWLYEKNARDFFGLASLGE